MKTQIIQLEEHDDILSAKDKIGWSQANRVLLVWPEKGNVLSRRIDLVLLQRHVQEHGGRLALITRSRQAKVYARELGIPIFRSPKQAQRQPWRSVPRKSITEASEKERREKLYHLRDQALTVRPKMPARLLPRLIPFVAGLAAFIALALFFLPSASVTVDPAEQPQEVTLDVWADPTILSPNASGSIPARIVSATVEGEQQAASTGRATLPAATSTGTVSLTNLTGEEIPVPAGAVVTTQDSPPVRFETSEAVTVAPGPNTSADAPVRALLGGSGSNVAAGDIATIEGNLGLSLAVTNGEPTSGGTDRNSSSPSETDYEKLNEGLRETLQAQALEQMQSSLDEDATLLPASLRLRSVIQETRQPEVGQPGERLQLKLRMEYSAWTVSEQDVRQLVETVLNAGLPQGYLDVPGSLEITRLNEPARDGERVHWQVRAARRIYHPIDPDAIARAIAGRNPALASRFLQQQLALQTAPQIRVAPAWWNLLPFLPLRIEVSES